MDDKPVSDEYIRKCRDLTGYPDAMLGMRSQEVRSLLDEVAARRRAAPALNAAVAALEVIASDPHQQYDHPEVSGPPSYATGIADGHRCAANKARTALDAMRAKAAAGQTKDEPAAGQQGAEGGTPEERAAEAWDAYRLSSLMSKDGFVVFVAAAIRAAVAAEKAETVRLKAEELAISDDYGRLLKESDGYERAAAAAEAESARLRAEVDRVWAQANARADKAEAEVERLKGERDEATKPLDARIEWLERARGAALSEGDSLVCENTRLKRELAEAQASTRQVRGLVRLHEEALAAALATTAAPAQRAEAGEAVDAEAPLRAWLTHYAGEVARAQNRWALVAAGSRNTPAGMYALGRAEGANTVHQFLYEKLGLPSSAKLVDDALATWKLAT